ncbi:MAG: Spy/CpxP family protein refolding chaperone [Vicinamibacterales bacterium]|nr:Spy/CpxP family protein refolding chaperone [Vicinamibacterales bacterium]
MKLVRLVVVVAVLAAFCPGAAHAQGFKWWQDEKVKAELSLTAEQVVNLENVFLELIPRMAAEKEALDKLESQLSTVIRDANMSEAEVVRQIDVVEGARSALGKTRTLMIYRLYRSLSPDQRTKMKALHQKWEDERRKGGRR